MYEKVLSIIENLLLGFNGKSYALQKSMPQIKHVIR